MKAWISLCDFGQVHAGKAYVVGGGVAVAFLPVQLGIVVEVLVPWQMRSRRVSFRVDLIDSDNRPVTTPTLIADAQQGGPLEVRGLFEAVPPSGATEGSDIPFVVAFNVNGLPLQPSQSYTWRLFVGEEEAPSATRSFSTAQRPVMVQPQQ